MSEPVTYLAKKKILIADPSGPTRLAILKALHDLGAKREDIVAARSFEEAEFDITSRKPEVVIAEYNLDKKFGLDLLPLIAQYAPNPKDRMFVLITKNSSESAVAEAAEEDVDAYILKPFSHDTLTGNIVKAIEQKLDVTEYKKAIDDGKSLLVRKEFPQARQKFHEAKTLDSQPTLACYYLANVHELSQQLEAAISEYRSGLKFNPIHYKCLVGMFEVLDRMDRKKEAYEVIQSLVQHFPISPQRLGKIFTLAIYTQNFTDVNKYYELFKTLDHRSEELTRVVFGGLFVCGKYFFNQGDFASGESIFTKLVVSSGRSDTILEKIIGVCVEHQQYEMADRFLCMVSVEGRGMMGILELDFTISSKISPPETVISKGMELIRLKSNNSMVYETTIQLLLSQRRIQVAEEFIYIAAQRFPEDRDKSLAYLPAA